MAKAQLADGDPLLRLPGRDVEHVVAQLAGQLCVRISLLRAKQVTMLRAVQAFSRQPVLAHPAHEPRSRNRKLHGAGQLALFKQRGRRAIARPPILAGRHASRFLIIETKFAVGLA